MIMASDLGSTLLALNLGEPIMWGSVTAFAIAILILSALDIPLPRGDIIGVGGTLDAVALAVLGPFSAAVSCLLGVTGALALRKSSRGVSDVVQTVLPRLSGIALASLLYFAAPSPDGASSWVQRAAGVSVYLIVELVAAQMITSLRSKRSLRRLLRGNIDRLAPVLAAELSAAMLAIMVYPDMGGWSLLLVVALLMLMRQSYSLLLEIGETYRTTVEVLVQAAEGLGSERQGHADRSAQIARELGMACGLSPRQVERVSYAALLHDIDALSYGGEAPGSRPTSSSVLEGIPFFGDVIDILRVCDGVSHELPARQDDLLEAFIVALSSDVDAAIHTHAHAGDPHDAVERVAPLVPSALKARAVAAAIQLGYSVPAVA